MEEADGVVVDLVAFLGMSQMWATFSGVGRKAEVCVEPLEGGEVLDGEADGEGSEVHGVAPLGFGRIVPCQSDRF